MRKIEAQGDKITCLRFQACKWKSLDLNSGLTPACLAEALLDGGLTLSKDPTLGLGV